MVTAPSTPPGIGKAEAPPGGGPVGAIAGAEGLLGGLPRIVEDRAPVLAHEPPLAAMSGMEREYIR